MVKKKEKDFEKVMDKMLNKKGVKKVAEYKVKCSKPGCSNYFEKEGSRKYCDEHRTNLQVGNPKGYNRYKKNPNPPAKALNQLEEFSMLPTEKQRQLVAELGNQVYMLTKELRPLMMRFKKFKDFYEQEHFGWDWEDD